MRVLLFAALGALVAAPSLAGSIAGSVSVTDKGGRPASDLQETVVYLEGARAAKAKPAAERITMRGKAFQPHVVVVPVGGSVAFPNEDPILHNAFSVSGENRFDLDLYKRPQSKAWVFPKPGVVRVYCNIHPQMSAIVVVADSSYYAKAGRDGSFSLEDVPPGKYLLKAWHERGGETSQPVTVPAEGGVSAQLVLDASSFKRVQHKNKFGKDYSAAGEKY